MAHLPIPWIHLDLVPTMCQALFPAEPQAGRVPGAGDANTEESWYLAGGRAGNRWVSPETQGERRAPRPEGVRERGEAGRALRPPRIASWNRLPSAWGGAHTVSSAPREWTSLCLPAEHTNGGTILGSQLVGTV